jgi:peptide chain release factor 1
MTPHADETNGSLNEKLAAIAEERDALAAQLGDPAVLADHTRVRDLSIRKAALDPIADAYRRAATLRDEAAELRAAIDAGDDAELAEMARQELPRVEQQAASLIDDALEGLVNAEDRAVSSVVLEIRAGVGGDEAGIWANDLLTMYARFAQHMGWSIELIDADADESTGGVRAAVLTVSGDAVFHHLSHEAGTHCVKRVPATETQGRIHTSTATVAVLPEPKAVEFALDPSEVEEHITTAQGPGGQNVNKVATAVHLIHTPTGVEVRMQETKSQRQNREKAWRVLAARLYERELESQRAEASAERNAQIGGAGRAERIRTYRFKDSIAVDHRLGESFNLTQTLAGDLGPVAERLQRRQTAERLERL